MGMRVHLVRYKVLFLLGWISRKLCVDQLASTFCYNKHESKVANENREQKNNRK